MTPKETQLRLTTLSWLKRVGIVFLVLFMLVSTQMLSAAGPTNVSGPLAANTIWSPTKNPYIVTGDVTVPLGVTLTILPGVEVRFNNTDDRAGGSYTTKPESHRPRQAQCDGHFCPAHPLYLESPWPFGHGLGRDRHRQ